jgi:hypothetical protein
MLIYATHLHLQPENGHEDILKAFSKWIASVTNTGADMTEVMSKTKHDFGHKGALEIAQSERLFGATFSVVDGKDPRRTWITDVGFSKLYVKSSLLCSIVLRIEGPEPKKIFINKPRFVETLIERCKPLPSTPGLMPRTLTLDAAQAFIPWIDNPLRETPVVVLSAHKEQGYPVDPERLRKSLLGWADLVVIPEGENTVELEQVAGKGRMAFNGSIRTLFGNLQPEQSSLFLFKPTENSPEGFIEQRVLAALAQVVNPVHAAFGISRQSIISDQAAKVDDPHAKPGL